jgi:glycosyltransferase involved in cell wall biosynthesis
LLAAQSTGVLGTRESPNTHTAHAYAVARDEALRVGSPSVRGQSHHPNPRRLAREEAEFRAARLILVPSERVSETFVEAGVDEAKLARHRYGFDPAVFHPIGRTDDGSRPFTAVFAGSAEPRKGLHYALEAWRRSGIGADGRFRILGRFAPGYRERLGSLLEQPGVEVAGFSDDLAGEFRAADVLVLPSVEEGSALVGYEAQACGCVPLLSRSAGGQFRPGLDGFLHEDRDAETLAEQLRLLHGDPGTLRRMRESCLDGAAALTWDAAGVRMLEIFSAALGR